MEKRALQAVATIGDVPPSVAAAYALGFKAGSAFNVAPASSLSEAAFAHPVFATEEELAAYEALSAADQLLDVKMLAHRLKRGVSSAVYRNQDKMGGKECNGESF